MPFSSTTGISSCAATTRWSWRRGEALSPCAAPGDTPRDPSPCRKSYPEVLALGPQIKSTLCILKKGYAFLSPHIGDLETPEARDFFHESIALMERITECRPRLIACDLHPGYYTSRVARRMAGREVVAVQHHHAHIVSVMAENRLGGEVIGLAMDGTGYGTDGAGLGRGVSPGG